MRVNSEHITNKVCLSSDVCVCLANIELIIFSSKAFAQISLHNEPTVGFSNVCKNCCNNLLFVFENLRKILYY